MIGWLYILIAIMAFGLLSFICKYGSTKGSSPLGIVLTLFLAATSVMGCVVIVNRPPFTWTTILLGCAGGIGGAVAFLLFVEAMRFGHYALTVAIMGASFVVQLLFSAIAWGPILPAQAAGIVMLVGAVFLITYSGSSAKDRSGGSWSRWALRIGPAFVLNGIPMICQDKLGHTAESVNAYMFVIYLSGGLCLLPLAMGKGRVMPRTFLFGALAGGGSVTGVFFSQLALTALPDGLGSMVVFPVTLSGQVMCGVLLSLAFFREKINWLGYIGFALELAGIAVLSVPKVGQGILAVLGLYAG